MLDGTVVIYDTNPAAAHLNRLTVLLRSRVTLVFREGHEFEILGENTVQLTWLDNCTYEVQTAWDNVNQRIVALYNVPPGDETKWVWPLAVSINYRTYQTVYGFYREQAGGTTLMLRIPGEHVVSMWNFRHVRPFTCNYGELISIARKLFSSLAEVFHDEQLCVVNINPHLIKIAELPGGLFIPVFGDLSKALPASPHLMYYDVSKLASSMIRAIYGCEEVQSSQHLLALLNPTSMLDNILKQGYEGYWTAAEMAARLSQLDPSSAIQEMPSQQNGSLQAAAAALCIPRDGELALLRRRMVSMNYEGERIQQESAGNNSLAQSSVGFSEISPEVVASPVQNQDPPIARAEDRADSTSQKDMTVRAQATTTENSRLSLETPNVPFRVLSQAGKGHRPPVVDTALVRVPPPTGAESAPMREVATSGYVTEYSDSRDLSQPEGDRGTHVPPGDYLPHQGETTQEEGLTDDLRCIYSETEDESDQEGH